MKIIDSKIPDVKIIEPAVFGDERGFFIETWNQQTFTDAGLDIEFVQDNHSRSGQGILRGLHYQMEQTQGKLVHVITGKVYDVAVDMRKSSDTFGQSVGIELSDQNHRMLWVPPGFAHGFYVMSEMADFVYKCTDLYAPQHERSLLWNDPALKIEWPLLDGVKTQLSTKDIAGTPLASADTF
ncbi:MAG: dTDP-4-dehydrorhamnose 3,5-epimerase (EC [uncultured Thiotrichaceae bacterium]|uniref:dTDP-4-dehydrorhamnose 3,5-epimerase n=1 Tax=uncultured Thiotrichaceae bacterium TaxID=298394 RepID=A0A6S6U0F4_9GAMM|nr:MAG: dTDP-4-dehydrorhamnose 3,5-epimerase (EC [uncultured Thiotrichaceae bacterium]